MARPQRPLNPNKAKTASQHRAASPAPSGSAVVRPEVIFIRESSEHDMFLLSGMCSRVLNTWVREYPQVQPLIDALPLLVQRTKHGAEARAQFICQDLRAPSSDSWWGWEFRVGTVRVLICPASARKLNDQDVNDVTEGVIDYLDRERPARVVTGPFDRMGRSVTLLSMIYDSLVENNIEFGCFENHNFDLVNQAMAWDLMARMAENYVSKMLEQTFAGRVYWALQGRYPNGPQTLGFGINKDSETGRLSWTEDQKEIVKKMLQVATEETDAEKVMAKWAQLGVDRVRRNSKDKEKGHVGGIDTMKADPRTFVRRRLRWLDTYATGVLSAVITNPLPRQMDPRDPEVPEKTFHGQELRYVDLDNEKDSGFIVVNMQVGEPLIDEATAQKIHANWAPTGECGACKTCQDPELEGCDLIRTYAPSLGGLLLTNIPDWCDETYQWRWSQRGGAYYALFRRSVELAATPWSDNPGERLAIMRADEVNAKLRSAAEVPFTETRTSGLVLRPAAEVAEENQKIATLRSTSAAKSAEAASIRSTLGTVGSSLPVSAVEIMRQTAAALETEALEAEQAADVLVDSRYDQVTLTGAGNVDCTKLSELMTYARTTADLSVPRQVQTDARRILGANWRAEVRHTQVSVTTYAALTANTGQRVEVGPITFAVSNRMFKNSELLTLAARRAEAVEMLMTSDITVPGLAVKVGMTPESLRNMLLTGLDELGVPAGQGRGALMVMPVIWPRLLVWEALTGKRDSRLDGLDSDVANRIRTTYLDPNFRGRGWVGEMGKRRVVLDYLAAYQSEAPEGIEARELAVITGDDRLLVNFRRDTSSAYPAVLRTTVAGNRWSPTLVGALECKHCGPGHWATHILNVPEMWSRLLCTTCGQEPDRKGVWPVEYRTRWVGAADTGNAHEVIEAGPATVQARPGVRARMNVGPHSRTKGQTAKSRKAAGQRLRQGHRDAAARRAAELAAMTEQERAAIAAEEAAKDAEADRAIYERALVRYAGLKNQETLAQKDVRKLRAQRNKRRVERAEKAAQAF